jgi:hypothetical protein
LRKIAKPQNSRAMKRFILPCACLLLLSTGLSACVVVEKHDNGNHRGWYKNPQNPHNPQSTKQTGNGKNKK